MPDTERQTRAVGSQFYPLALASDEMKQRTQRGGVIELFAGIGCVIQGFARAGFDPIMLTDHDLDARDTYRHNFPKGARYLRRDVRHLRPKHILDVADGREILGLLGGPPCQGFSAAGSHDARDDRNALLRDYFRLAKSLKPRFILMENVPRVLDFDLFEELLDQVELEYDIWRGVLNAALFGVPQTRQRTIVIGYRRDLGVVPTPPTPTHLGSQYVFDYTSGRLVSPTGTNGAALFGVCPELGRAGDWWNTVIQPNRGVARALPDLVQVGDALQDLPDAADSDRPLPYRKAGSDYARALRDGQVVNHRRWRHRPGLKRRLRCVPEGGGLLDRFGRSRERPYFSQAYARLHRRGLARTITTNFHNPGSGRFLHYEANRTLTVREAARLQGIPDSFVFIKNPSVQERLVGNAFPPPFAEALALHISAELAEALS